MDGSKVRLVKIDIPQQIKKKKKKKKKMFLNHVAEGAMIKI